MYTIPFKVGSVSTKRSRKERKRRRRGEGFKCHLLEMTEPTYHDLTVAMAVYIGPTTVSHGSGRDSWALFSSAELLTTDG